LNIFIRATNQNSGQISHLNNDLNFSLQQCFRSKNQMKRTLQIWLKNDLVVEIYYKNVINEVKNHVEISLGNIG